MGKRILIVDDQVSIRNMLSDLFGSAGFEVTLAENGQHALDLAREIHPHIVVMDLMMPIMSGLDAAKAMRADSELVSVPILFLTARGQAQDEKKALEAGGNAFIPKPFSPRLVMAKVQELLGGP